MLLGVIMTLSSSRIPVVFSVSIPLGLSYSRLNLRLPMYAKRFLERSSVRMPLLLGLGMLRSLLGVFDMRISACLSNRSDDWRTPSYIYDRFAEKGFFDPCPFKSTFDGLSIPWKRDNFVNPPYSQLRKWIEKSIEEHGKGNNVWLLIPARTDTKGFKMLFEYGSLIYFVSGRLRFNEAGYAPFPSMLVRLVGGGSESTICGIVERDNILL